MVCEWKRFAIGQRCEAELVILAHTVEVSTRKRADEVELRPEVMAMFQVSAALQ